MLKFTIALILSVFTFYSFATSIKVKNIAELNAANKNAKPGDIIELKNGEWTNVNIVLDCNGTEKLPITFKAETVGKVIITGKSSLSIGGSFILIDGFYFTNGYSGKESVITFKAGKSVANYCTIKNTVINDFNNPKRLDENYWLELYGKHNTITKCSFLNKKNIGVLMAVILNDKKSQDNFHSINHNYFGVRIPLASNGGEIIRVGVSEQCQYNSNTQITDNFFENCDGETEIISLKSGSNVVRNNLFKECQGAVVLRHGNFNTIENNVFFGNDKEGTGGVRIINKGQWVVNNLFYKCRGENFRSPLAIMNGIPNSPAFRYVAVSDAVIYGNTFFECAPISFCEGSDTERTLPPKNTLFANNIIYNTTDSIIYKVSDDINGISFNGNFVNAEVNQQLFSGFEKGSVSLKELADLTVPQTSKTVNQSLEDSLKIPGEKRLSAPIRQRFVFDKTVLKKAVQNAGDSCGAKWFKPATENQAKHTIVTCKTGDQLQKFLSNHNEEEMNIVLSESEYTFSDPVSVFNNAIISSRNKKPIKFIFQAAVQPFLFLIKAGGSLNFKNIHLDLAAVKSLNFIATDTAAPSNHLNFGLINCVLQNSNSTLFYASKSAVCDSIIINEATFNNCNGTLFNLAQETDKKGYYPVEKMKISKCIFNNNAGEILHITRTGNDESTMGPKIIFENNELNSCTNSLSAAALITLWGVQKSLIQNNIFNKNNSDKILIEYKDEVRAIHLLKNNKFISSGTILKNKYVTEQ